MKTCAIFIVFMACVLVPSAFADEVDDAIARLKSDDYIAQENAYKSLGDLGGPKALKALIAAFQKEDNPALADAAAAAMAKIGGPQAEKVLLDELAGDSASRWGSATKGLGLMKSKRAVTPLCAALKKQYMWREEAARALGVIGDSRAVDPLVAVIPASQEDTSDISGRVAIAEALGNLGEPRAAKGLLLLLKDESSMVRDAAAAALENVGWTAKTGEEKMLVALQMRDWDTLAGAGEKAIPVLILGLDGEATAETARKMLVPFGARAIKPLIAALPQNHPQSPKARGVEETLVEIGPATFDPLVALLKSPHWNSRAAAVIALGELKDERAIGAIARFLVTEASTQSAGIACDAFKNMGDAGRERLIAMLEGKDGPARFWAGYVLGHLEEDVTERILAIGKASKNRDVRGACAWVLEAAHKDELQSACADLLGADPAQAAKDYEKILTRGIGKSYWLLLAGLERSGNVEMATRLLNCGDTSLRDAAELWAGAHGYRVLAY